MTTKMSEKRQTQLALICWGNTASLFARFHHPDNQWPGFSWNDFPYQIDGYVAPMIVTLCDPKKPHEKEFVLKTCRDIATQLVNIQQKNSISGY